MAELYRPYGATIVLDRCYDLAVHHDQVTGVVVLEYASQGRVVATGAAYSNRYISVLSIVDRKVAHWRDYLDPRAETFYGDWERVAGECVAILRWAAGRDPHDRDLSNLIGELATQSDAFRTRWAAHDVRFHNTGVKHFHHPVVGELSLTYNRMDLPADHGLTIFTYAAEPGSRSEEALKLLGSWAATAEPARSVRTTDQS